MLISRYKCLVLKLNIFGPSLIHCALNPAIRVEFPTTAHISDE